MNNTGIVSWVSINRCKILSEGHPYDCILKRDTGGIAVGDFVEFKKVQDTCIIEKILPRSTIFKRASSRPPYQDHIMAVNIDIVVAVVSVKVPPLHPRLIDRIIVAARMSGTRPVICVNKIDLLNSEVGGEMKLDLQDFEDLNIDIARCSAKSGQGIDELLKMIKGRTCAFIGHSGVGKSSLLNSIVPGMNQSTGRLRDSDGKGRHTTTSSTLVELSDGTRIIDTPGFREFSLGKMTEAEIAEHLFDLHSIPGVCKHKGCTHSNEPGCRIRDAVREGLLPRNRYESYLRLCGKSPSDINVDPNFICKHCGELVITSKEMAGTAHRNHCPYCLWSLHLDHEPGDRASCCGGLMEPIAVWVRKGGEWALVHRCQECGKIASNRIAADDNEALLLSIAVRPLSMPAFPLDRIGRSLSGYEIRY